MCKSVGEDQPTAVFELSKAQLRPVVERIAGGVVDTFDVSVEPHAWDHYGVRGEKLIATFLYASSSGQRGSATVFAKRQCDPVTIDDSPVEPRPLEAHHYTQLRMHGAPIPRMYGALTVCDPGPREILFLEYLEDVVTEDEPWEHFLADSAHYQRYLTVLARFAAIHPSGEYAAQLPAPHLHFLRQMSDWPARLDRVWTYARQGRLGREAAKLCSDYHRRRIQEVAERTRDAIAHMPMGLSAGDHEPFQSGRSPTGEVVLFDFEFTGYAPRFYDVAVTLGAPDEYCPRCSCTKELARCYLDEYSRCGGDCVSVKEFVEETRALWLAWTIGWIQYSYVPESEEHRHSADLLERKLACILSDAG